MTIHVNGTFLHGQSAVILSPTSYIPDGELRSGITIMASPDNSQIVYIGNSAEMSTSDGFPLSPGARILIPIDNTSKIFLRTLGVQDISFIGS